MTRIITWQAGNRALHLASAACRPEAIRALLQSGAQLDLRNKVGERVETERERDRQTDREKREREKRERERMLGAREKEKERIRARERSTYG